MNGVPFVLCKVVRHLYVHHNFHWSNDSWCWSDLSIVSVFSWFTTIGNYCAVWLANWGPGEMLNSCNYCFMCSGTAVQRDRARLRSREVLRCIGSSRGYGPRSETKFFVGRHCLSPNNIGKKRKASKWEREKKKKLLHMQEALLSSGSGKKVVESLTNCSHPLITICKEDLLFVICCYCVTSFQMLCLVGSADWSVYIRWVYAACWIVSWNDNVCLMTMRDALPLRMCKLVFRCDIQ